VKIRSSLQQLSPLFSSTSPESDFNLLVFINIARDQFSVIFSPFVFNNIARLSFIFPPPRVFSRQLGPLNLTPVISIRYNFYGFSLSTANPFIF